MSTPDAGAVRPGRGTRRGASGAIRVARLVHPFPSILDGLATAAIAALAGGALPVALRLGLAMTLIQFGIGALNDAVDAGHDRGRHDKPVASGAVSPRSAATAAVVCASSGLALAALSGLPVLAIAAAGLALGVAYDVRLKRTPLAWLPFAIAIPLLVVFAWYGAIGRVGLPLVALLPAAALAGASLALGNALVDPEADRSVGLVTPVVALGPAAAWRWAALLMAGTIALAAASLGASRAPSAALLAVLAAGAVAGGGLTLTRDARRTRRERGWELQAVGIALLGAAWVAGVALAGG